MLDFAADSLSRIPISDQNDSIPVSDITEEFIEKHFDHYCAPTSKNITEKISKKKQCSQTDKYPLYIIQPQAKTTVPQIQAEPLKDCQPPPSEIGKELRTDSYFSKVIHNLETGNLLVEDKYARPILVESEFYHLQDQVLYRANLTNYSSNAKKYNDSLCLPLSKAQQVVQHYYEIGHAGTTRTFLWNTPEILFSKNAETSPTIY